MGLGQLRHAGSRALAMRDKPLSGIASMHARSAPAAEALRAVAKFLRGLVETAERCIDGGKSSREPSKPSSKAVPCALLCV